MDALLMCGGRGTRLDAGEKPLFEVSGEPMINRVLAALETSSVGAIHAVTSPHTPKTTDHLDGCVPLLEGDGKGYVADLTAALEVVDPPVVTVVSDLPLLASEHVDGLLEGYDGPSVTVCVPAVLKELLGVSAETTRAHGGHELAPTGLNVVGETDAETLDVSYDARLAVNVNYPSDAAVAEVLADGP